MFMLALRLLGRKGQFVMVGLLLMGVATSSFTLLQPVAIGALVDGRPLFGFPAALALVAILLCSLWLTGFRGMAVEVAGQWLLRRIRLLLAERLSRSVPTLKNQKRIDFIEAISLNDAPAIATGVIVPVVSLTSSLIVLGGAGLFFVQTDPRIILIVLGCALVGLFLGVAGLRSVKRVSAAELQANGMLIKSLTAFRQGFSLLRTCAGLQAHRPFLEPAVRGVYGRAIDSIRVRMFFGILSESMFALATVIAAAYAGLILLPAGQVTSGDVAKIFVLGGMVVDPIQTILSILLGAQRTTAAMERFSAVFDVPVDEMADMEGAASVAGSAYDLKGVALDDLKGGAILEPFDLSLGRGDLVAIVGPSGAGKSSLIKVLSGLSAPDSGEIRVDGKAVGTRQLHTLSAGVAYQSQDDPVFPTSPLGNVLLDPSIGRDQALEALAVLDNAVTGEAVTDKYESPESSDHLSGGERQRLALARALSSDRPVLIFDEPTSALDQELTEQVWGMIAGASEKLRLVVTHDLELARKADYVVLVDRGRVAAMSIEIWNSGRTIQEAA